MIVLRACACLLALSLVCAGCVPAEVEPEPIPDQPEPDPVLEPDQAYDALDLSCVDEVLPIDFDGQPGVNQFIFGTSDAWGD